MIKMDKERQPGIFYTASISGGKDSICMGLMLLERGYPVDDFIFFDMGVEYPETYEAIAKFEQDTGRKVARVTPPEGDFWYYACEREYICRGKKKGIPSKGYGFPAFNVRWCTRAKQDAISKYEKEKGYTKQNTIQYIGIAADEPKRIRDLADKRYPLYEWGVTEADALKYCKSRGYYPPRIHTTIAIGFPVSAVRSQTRSKSNTLSSIVRNCGNKSKITRLHRKFAAVSGFSGNSKAQRTLKRNYA